MKRFLHFLLLVLLIASTVDAASSKARRKKRTRPQPEVEVEAVIKSGSAVPVQGIRPERKDVSAAAAGDDEVVSPRPGGIPFGKPVELSLRRGASRRFDLRTLPQVAIPKVERPEREDPPISRTTAQGLPAPEVGATPSIPGTNAPAPPPNANFAGLDFNTFGNGHPPDTVGDVGPQHYIQSINSSLGIYDKATGTRLAAFSLNTFMSQGAFGNLCDTNNFGDPVILYDTFEDRWVVSDFAFQLSGGSVVNPPGAFQCFAVSMSGDPVSGGWNFYSINTPFGLGDYPKLGVWPDGIYMSANMFGFPSGAPYQNAKAIAFNKAQMYAGLPNAQVVSFDILGGDFTVIPSNARLQAGTPPPGTPNYYLSTWLFLNAVTVYKFHVDWNSISLSTFTGPDTPLAATSWPNAAVANAPSLGGNAVGLDTLNIRAMMQNQYSRVGATESLWATHTVRRANTSGFAAPRWYQVDVTGGNVNANIPQAATWDPDAANVMHRFQPSLAVDHVGNMAVGYSTSNATTKPAIKYAGRLFSDPLNTFSQTEQLLIQGTGTQVGNCGGSPCARWGDYAAMSLDPDGCTFWLTHMYYAVDGLDHQTRIGSFGPFPGCTPVGNGTLSGTVTALSGGAPISGATLQLGTRTTTTDGSGNYSFTIPSGTYTNLLASKPGFITGSASALVVPDAGTLTQNFALATAPASACLVDSTQAELQTGIPTAVDLLATPGSAVLSNGDPQNFLITTSGGGFSTTTWAGQTFTPIATGDVTKIDMNLFCSGCSGTTPNLTVSIRATASGFPTGPDLGTATIPGFFNAGAASYFSANFAPPVTLTGGTMYAFVIRPVANPSAGTYAFTRSGADVYPGGTRVAGATSGTVWSNPLTATQTTDAGFRVFMARFLAAGNLVSSVKDSNPAGGFTPIYGTFSWNATTPPNTSVRFQIAASNSASGPFNFVGPNGTAGTFFTTSPVQLSPQFYGLRYLKYKAFLDTTDAAVTPTLNDVSICFSDVDCSGTTPPITPTPPQVCENSTGNTASGPAGMTAYSWGITNGTITSATNIQTITYTAGASGTVTLTLTVTTPSGCITPNSIPVTINANPTTPTITPTPAQVCANSTGNFADGPAGATTYAWSITNGTITSATNLQTIAYTAGASGTVGLTLVVTNAAGCSATNTVNVTINANPAAPTITPTPATVCGGSAGNSAAGPAGATTYAWSIVNGTITSATNIQTITYTAGATGTVDLTLVVTNAAGCPASTTVNVPINASPATPTITPTPATVCTNSTGNSAAGPAGATTYAWSIVNGTITSATNIQTITYTAGASGTVDLTLVVTNASTCSATNTVNVTIDQIPPQPTITPSGSVIFCDTGLLTSSSATGNQWYYNGNILNGETNQTLTTVDADGDYTVKVTIGSCTSPVSAVTNVDAHVRPGPAFLSAGGPTTFCTGGSVTLMSNSATGIQWYLDGNLLPGPHNQNRTVSVGGTYTVTLNNQGCVSQPSNAIVVTVNTPPSAPTITPTPASVCPNSTGNSAAGPAGATTYAWSITNGTITSATNAQNVTYTAGASGSVGLTLVVTNAANCSATNTVNVTINASPATPTITPTPASVCPSSTGNTAAGPAGATTYAWSITTGTITSATNAQNVTYTAGASGSVGLTLVVTNASGCSATNTANVTINPNPATPTITPTPASVCASSAGNSAAGPAGATTYAWSITNGTITSAANIQTITYSAGASGTVGLTLVVTNASGCSATNTANVTINPLPDATITAPASVGTGSTGNAASVANAGAGATYAWSVTNGTLTGGAGTTNITFTAGASGSVTLQVTVSRLGCSDTKSVGVPISPVTVTSVVPSSGKTTGGKNVTINGTNFLAGATVTFGGSAATSVVVVNSTKITAKTPAHAAGFVNVTVTNTNTSSGTLTNGYKYVSQQFDANGDNVIDPADIFWLVNYLFLSGPAPAGASGIDSGDANGDGVVDPADIFYLVNYLFLGGPAPAEAPSSDVSAQSVSQPISGAVTLGEPVLRGGRYVVPVSVNAAPGSQLPRALSLRVLFRGDAVRETTVHRAGAVSDVNPAFEISRTASNALTYLLSFDDATGLSGVVAEIEVEARAGARVRIEVDPALTLLTNRAGTQKATVAAGTLRVSGTTIDGARLDAPRKNVE